MKLSVYHFWRGNATAEANFFLSKIKQLGLPTSTPVVCDYEASPSSASSINAFFSVLENAGYKNISIYTMSSWVKAGRLSGVKGYQWIASYGVSKCPVPCDAWHGGFTDNYLRISSRLPPQYDNKIVNMRLGELLDDGETLQAEIV